jgi:RES domain-containing protein
MKLWRISNYADLQGKGGLRASGRWHNRGIPIVYLAESPALALLEVLVHFELDLSEIPRSYQLLEIDYTQSAGLAQLPARILHDNWSQNLELTRAIGDEWLTSGSSLLLRVPSVIVPQSFNYLFNPRHPLAPEAKIISATFYPYDARLISSGTLKN